jgi:chemotaxis protein methyltransferase CheR
MNRSDESISNADFTRLRGLIYEQAGISLSPDKKTMIELRIKRRVRSLLMGSFREYCEYLFGVEGQKEELVHFIDVLTTNKTDFFREPGHFDFLVEKALPDLGARAGGERELLIWSAGCSTGEEPYTLAIVLTEYGLTHPGFRFRLLATDIATTVLEAAHRGIYKTEVISPVPAYLRRKYFLRSRDPDSQRVRVVPELRRLIEFRRVNFKDVDFGFTEKADAIFCRNVLIYFDRPTQEHILQKLARHLIPNGYLFVGHAEALHGMNLPLDPVAPSVYRKLHARN